MISATALKASQCRAHSAQLRFRPPNQRIKQTSALAEREKQKMQLSHSLAEPRPPGIALRSRSKTANGPCSFAIRWLSLKVASDPRTKINQRTARNGYLAALMFTTDIRSVLVNRIGPADPPYAAPPVLMKLMSPLRSTRATFIFDRSSVFALRRISSSRSCSEI